MQTGRRTIAALWALTLCLGSCADSPDVRLPPDGLRPLGWVDVLVGDGDAVAVGCDGSFVVADGDGMAQDDVSGLGQNVALSLRAGEVFLGERRLGLAPLELRPSQGSVLSCQGVRFRGLLRIEVRLDGLLSSLRVMNRLHVDDYLKGVVPGEMPDRFGVEALAAQAVAARSYALAEIGRRGWLYADQRSQVYGGLAAETHVASEAIDHTSSQVLTYDGSVITAWFHSTCGGATSPARLAFTYPPVGVFETSVPCPDCKHSPTWSWSRLLEGPRVCEALGLPVGPITAVSFEPNTLPSIPEQITVVAGGESVTVSARAFRASLSKGRPFAEQLLSARWAEAPRLEQGALLISGRGWGHGVGLCQYGAGGFASRGADYRAILSHYYPHTELIELT